MARIDAELDLHGFTAQEARTVLEGVWSRKVWHGKARVRIIHGTGEVLWSFVRTWADEKGITWTLEGHNTGVTILHPGSRSQTSHLPNRPFTRHHDVLRKAIEQAAASSGPKVTRSPKPVPPTAAVSSAPKEVSISETDLFKQEMERLADIPSTTLQRRKRM